MAARTNSSWAPRGPRSRSRPSFRIRFKCANLISIFLRSRRDFSKSSVSANDRATSRACSWMSRGILRDGSFGQHCGLSGHTSQSSLLARYRSVLPSCTVPLVPSLRFSARAVVNVAGRIISKVAAGEGAVVPLRFVEHGNMRCDAFLLDQPVQHRSSPVGGIPDKPLRLETKALFGPLNHGPRRTDLGLANGAGGLDINDDAELHVDEIIVEEAKNAGPLCAPVHWAAGSDGETNFGTTSLAAPQAVSSRVARYSFTARLDLAGTQAIAISSKNKMIGLS